MNAHLEKTHTTHTTRGRPRRTLGNIALTILRVVAGIIMIAHGWDKLAGFDEWQNNVASMGIPFPEISAGLSVAAELGGGIGLVLGALTPLAALGVFANMIVAIGAVHLGNGLFARNDGWEYPLTLAVIALFFVFRGAGPYSVDALLKRAARHTKERPEPRPYRRPIEEPA